MKYHSKNCRGKGFININRRRNHISVINDKFHWYDLVREITKIGQHFYD